MMGWWCTDDDYKNVDDNVLMTMMFLLLRCTYSGYDVDNDDVLIMIMIMSL
jgi:hypothetical protein